jgi:hypothetical protein
MSIVILAIDSRKHYILGRYDTSRVGDNLRNTEILATQLTTYDVRNFRQ